MKLNFRCALLTLLLSATFVAVAQASRRLDWAFGREWLTPVLMWMVLTAPLCYAVLLREADARKCCG